MVLFRRTLLIAAVASLRIAGAQTSTIPASALAVEEQTAERWMHGRQLARFTRFAHSQEFFVVDSIQSGATRRLFITLARTYNGRDSAVVVADSLGHVTHLEVGVRGPRHSVSEDELQMPETRLWELVPSVPRGTPRVGLTWQDTIDRNAVDGLSARAVHGTRISTIVGDTTVNGHRAWRVRDSAFVTLDEHFPQGTTPAESATRLSRSARGVIRGIHLYDPQRGLDLRRADTTRLAGEAVLRLPDGRVFRTPARFERMRQFDLYDSPAYAARRRALRAERERGRGGMVIVAKGWEKRLAEGDTRVLDSLIGVWRRTSDPDVAFDLFMNMQMWAGESRAKMLDSVRVAAGDTAWFYQVLTRGFDRGHSIDGAEARALIAYMDPAMAWSVGSSHEWLSTDIAGRLTGRPRAAGVARPACTVDGCAEFGRLWSQARDEPRRDLGLVALFTTDPTRWKDTVLALDGPTHPLLHGAALLARGIGATWPAASKASIPPAESDWSTWLEWMNGVDPAYARPDRSRGIIARVRFEESHDIAIRFQSAMTGRDIIGELRRGYEHATTDSTRFVFAFMLQRLGQLRMTEAEVADALTSGIDAREAIGSMMLNEGLHKSSKRMPDSSAALLFDRMIGAIVDGTPLWRSIGLLRAPTAASLPETHVDPHQRFVRADSLPAMTRTKWNGRANLISASAWAARDVKAAGVLYSISSVRMWGSRFARITVNLSEHVGRKNDEAAELYAAGVTYDLMLVDGEWVLVSASSWVT